MKSAAIPSCGHAVAAAFRAIWPELLLIRKCHSYGRECRTHLPAGPSAGHDLRPLGPIRPCALNAPQLARPIGPVGPTLYNSAYEARTPSSKDSAWTELNSKERPGNVGVVHEPVKPRGTRRQGGPDGDRRSVAASLSPVFPPRSA